MKKRNGVHHFADGGFGSGGFDLGDFDTLTAVSNLGGFGSGGIDLGSLDDIFAADALRDFGSGGFDLGSFDDILAVDALRDFGSGFDLGSFEDLAAIDALKDFGGAFDLGSFEDLAAVDALRDLSPFAGEDLTRSLTPRGGVNMERYLADKGGELGLFGYDMPPLDDEMLARFTERPSIDTTLRAPSDSGLGMRLSPVGRGQMALVDQQTGAQGLIGEGFRSGQDLRGSGTREEIARYTPGSADYSLRSGLETPDGLGMTADATRGMSLTRMGGGQGLTRYTPAEYQDRSILEDLVKRNPGQFKDIEDYLIRGEDLRPFRGTGGTLTSSGFLAQSSAANPLGAMYSIGDPKSFINRPSITGQQAVVSPGRTVVNNGNGTYTVSRENSDGTITRTVVDSSGREVTGGGGSGGGGRSSSGTTTQSGKKDLLSALLPLLLMALAMRDRGGGGSPQAVIPGLTATQRQTPYTQLQQAPGYRPGQGGITYFNPVQYAPRMAAGGIADLARGRLLDGKGDGVSDDIPAVIGTDQPARLARGEYVIDARTVAELGNGSTDAGAERLDEMRKRVHAKRRKAKVGQDSKAYKELPA